MQCIERMRPPQHHQVQFATVQSSVEMFYNSSAGRNHQEYQDNSEASEQSDEDESDEDEEDDYNKGHWTQRSS